MVHPSKYSTNLYTNVLFLFPKKLTRPQPSVPILRKRNLFLICEDPPTTSPQDGEERGEALDPGPREDVKDLGSSWCDPGDLSEIRPHGCETHGLLIVMSVSNLAAHRMHYVAK